MDKNSENEEGGDRSTDKGIREKLGDILE